MEFLTYENLRFIWWILIGVLWIGFAITEGFDMGVAMLIPFVGKEDEKRRIAINAVAPHWDGNQVWLILAAGALFAAWPIVYATVFSGMYLALMILLFSLFLRPTGFDYRSKVEDPRWRNMWDWGLFISGIVPPLIFGVAMGNLFLGVPFHYDEYMRSFYTGNFFMLLHPFAILAGLLGIAMFLMQGASYLMLRSTGSVHKLAQKYLQWAALAVIALFAVEGLWLWMGVDGYSVTGGLEPGGLSNPTNKTVEVVNNGWLQNYSSYPLTMIAPLIAFLGAIGAYLTGKMGKPALAFINSCLSLVGIILTAGFSLFPFILPSSSNPNHSLTIWDATSSELTLNIMFWVTMVFVPIILAYTIWGYVKLWRTYSEEFILENDHSLY